MNTTDLDQVGTHESIFTRGYEHGYLVAKIEDRVDFSCEILTSQQARLMALLAGKGALVRVGPPIRRDYEVNWTHLDVHFVNVAAA